MPGLSYSLPAWECITGAKLRKVPGSVCAGCSAHKGNYTRYPAIKAAQYYRLATLMAPDWIPAMVTQIKRQKFFRWHDSGDLQSVQHLINIFEVCKLTPATQHWLPTQERKFLPLNTDSIPKNLLIRLSNAKNDTKPGRAWDHWSTVVTTPRAGHVCPAPDQGNECGSCRACWSKDVKEIQYIDAEYDIGNLDKDDYNLTRIELVQETSGIIAEIKLISSN